MSRLQQHALPLVMRLVSGDKTVGRVAGIASMWRCYRVAFSLLAAYVKFNPFSTIIKVKVSYNIGGAANLPSTGLEPVGG